MKPFLACCVAVLACLGRSLAAAQPPPPILFNTNFESGALGRVEQLGEGAYRLHIPGQHDARGRNHQGTWFHARLDQVAGRDLALTFAGFSGEYNDLPSRQVKHTYLPVWSEDGAAWQRFEPGVWDTEKIELTVKIRPKGSTLWIAYLHPYPLSRIRELETEIARSPFARIETIGTSSQGRPLTMVTVTNFERPDGGKKVIWLIGRQHAWETDTSFVMEGALRAIVSDDVEARRMRDEVIFHFVPTMDPDGCVNGHVRFNANGYDVNRNWLSVDLRDKQWLQKMPEIWYVKKAIRDEHARLPISLVVNLHNNDTNEYCETMIDQAPAREMARRFFAQLSSDTIFDPSRPDITFTVRTPGVEPQATTSSLWWEFGIPTILIEQRIGPGKEIGRRATIEDRLLFGRQLIGVMVKAGH
jgi:hypothetical protein